MKINRKTRRLVAAPQLAIESLKPAAPTNATAPAAKEDIAEHEVTVVKRSRQKWGTAADAGFQIIPDVLFRCQRFLELDATDVVILSNIMLHWWFEEDLPHPRPSVIARRMNVSTRTVERHIEGMEKKGLITRLPSRAKNGKTVRPFDLSRLVLQLKHYAARNLEQRERGWGA
jgi:DNA-binding MarR family transcriptional regulator